MSDEHFDELTRQAGQGMSRRRLLRLLGFGAASGAAAGLGLGGRPGASATPAHGPGPAQVGGICALLFNLAAQVIDLPLVGPLVASIINNVAQAFGCVISGAPPPPPPTPTTAPPPPPPPPPCPVACRKTQIWDCVSTGGAAAAWRPRNVNVSSCPNQCPQCNAPNPPAPPAADCTSAALHGGKSVLQRSFGTCV